MLLSSGAGVFLTTIVVGAVSLYGSFHLMERPFLRDLIFYIVAAFFTFYICVDHKITLVEALRTSLFRTYDNHNVTEGLSSTNYLITAVIYNVFGILWRLITCSSVAPSLCCWRVLFPMGKGEFQPNTVRISERTKNKFVVVGLCPLHELYASC